MSAHRVFYIVAWIVFVVGGLWAAFGNPSAKDLFTTLFAGLALFTLAHCIDQP